MKVVVQSLKNPNYVKTTDLSVFNFLSLRWALLLSILGHILLFVVLCSFKIDAVKTTEVKPLEITVIDKVVTFQELKQEIEKVNNNTDTLQNKNLFANAVIKEYSNFEPVEKPLRTKEEFNSNTAPQYLRDRVVDLDTIAVPVSKQQPQGNLEKKSYTPKEIKDSIDYTNGQGTKTWMILIHSIDVNLPETGTRWANMPDMSKKVYFKDIDKINQKGVNWHPEGMYSNGEERTKAEADALGGWKNIWIDVLLDSVGEDGVRRIYVKFRRK